jgi:hypothetical protein
MTELKLRWMDEKCYLNMLSIFCLLFVKRFCIFELHGETVWHYLRLEWCFASGSFHCLRRDFWLFLGLLLNCFYLWNVFKNWIWVGYFLINFSQDFSFLKIKRLHYPAQNSTLISSQMNRYISMHEQTKKLEISIRFLTSDTLLHLLI